MSNSNLVIDGEVERPAKLSFADLEAMAAEYQLPDVSRFDPKRKGDAVTLAGLLAFVGAKQDAKWLGLHGSLDNFHASIPVADVRDKAFLIYKLDGQPLPQKAGGPFRFFIPDHAACQTHEIDECANVKFVDHIELTKEKGFDNRPHDAQEHEHLHQAQR